jgi:hypothetical protein
MSSPPPSPSSDLEMSLDDNKYFDMDIYYDRLFPPLPVRIRVRIDPPHPLVCRKRRLNGPSGPSDETGKT